MSDVACWNRLQANGVRWRLLLNDSLAMVGRCLRLSRRNVEVLLTSLMLPVILMLLFVYLFGGALNTGGPYVSYVVPGVLVLCAGFGSASTAVSVSQDMHGGIMDRFRSLDVNGAAVLSGHVTASLVRNVASTVLVFGVAFLIGFRSDGRTARLACGRRDPADVHPDHFRSGRAGRAVGPNTGGGKRFHLLSDVPALRQQRFRADRHDADLAARLFRSSADHSRSSRACAVC